MPDHASHDSASPSDKSKMFICTAARSLDAHVGVVDVHVLLHRGRVLPGRCKLELLEPAVVGIAHSGVVSVQDPVDPPPNDPVPRPRTRFPLHVPLDPIPLS